MKGEWKPGSRGLFTETHDLALPVEDPEFLPTIPAQTHFKVSTADEATMVILLDKFECGGRTWSGKAMVFRSGEGWINASGQSVPIHPDMWPWNGTPAVQTAHMAVSDHHPANCGCGDPIHGGRLG